MKSTTLQKMLKSMSNNTNEKALNFFLKKENLTNCDFKEVIKKIKSNPNSFNLFNELYLMLIIDKSYSKIQEIEGDEEIIINYNQTFIFKPKQKLCLFNYFNKTITTEIPLTTATVMTMLGKDLPETGIFRTDQIEAIHKQRAKKKDKRKRQAAKKKDNLPELLTHNETTINRFNKVDITKLDSLETTINRFNKVDITKLDSNDISILAGFFDQPYMFVTDKNGFKKIEKHVVDNSEIKYSQSGDDFTIEMSIEYAQSITKDSPLKKYILKDIQIDNISDDNIIFSHKESNEIINLICKSDVNDDAYIKNCKNELKRHIQGLDFFTLVRRIKDICKKATVPDRVLKILQSKFGALNPYNYVMAKYLKGFGIITYEDIKEEKFKEIFKNYNFDLLSMILISFPKKFAEITKNIKANDYFDACNLFTLYKLYYKNKYPNCDEAEAQAAKKIKSCNIALFRNKNMIKMLNSYIKHFFTTFEKKADEDNINNLVSDFLKHAKIEAAEEYDEDKQNKILSVLRQKKDNIFYTSKYNQPKEWLFVLNLTSVIKQISEIKPSLAKEIFRDVTIESTKKHNSFVDFYLTDTALEKITRP